MFVRRRPALSMVRVHMARFVAALSAFRRVRKDRIEIPSLGGRSAPLAKRLNPNRRQPSAQGEHQLISRLHGPRGFVQTSLLPAAGDPHPPRLHQPSGKRPGLAESRPPEPDIRTAGVIRHGRQPWPDCGGGDGAAPAERRVEAPSTRPERRRATPAIAQLGGPRRRRRPPASAAGDATPPVHPGRLCGSA